MNPEERIQSDSLIDLICGTTEANGILGDARHALATPTRKSHLAARSLGFVNAEHEVLAFLASEWFYYLVDYVLSACDGIGPIPCDPVHRYAEHQAIGQAILDQAFGGRIRMNSLEEVQQAPEPLCRASENGDPVPKPPDFRYYEYSVAKECEYTDVLSVLRVYDEIVLFEQVLRGTQLSDGSYELEGIWAEAETRLLSSV